MSAQQYMKKCEIISNTKVGGKYEKLILLYCQPWGTTSHNNAYTYDENDQLTKLSVDGVNSVLNSYDNRGNVSRIDLLNGISTTKEYNAANQLSSNQNKKIDSSIINSYDYTYDHEGDIT